MTNNAAPATAAAAAAHPPSPTWARTLMERWHTYECWFAVAAFGFIACLMLADVILREFIGPILTLLRIEHGPMGIFASQRMSVYALVMGSFAGIGIATATGSHLVPRVAFGWVPPAWGPALDRIADVITCLFLIAVAYFGFKFALSSRATGLRAPVLDWPIWPIQIAIPLGFLSAAVRYGFYAAWPALRPVPPEFQE